MDWHETEKISILWFHDIGAITKDERDGLLHELLDRCDMENINDKTTGEIKEILCL